MNCEQQANTDYARNPLVARGESKLPVISACSLYTTCCTLHALRSSGASRSTLNAQRAFSLVEVTLALMVMAVGILSIMSLFPAGLDQNARSIADTHAAFFAEEVFGGLQATAETNWAGLANVGLPIASTNWYEPPGGELDTVLTSGLTNKYIRTDPTHYEDHALRYRLVLTTNGLLKAATLFVWPGEFGSTNDPAMFYAEFFRWKQ